MTVARSAAWIRRIAPPGNPGFAKRALGFAKRAPGFPMLWIGSAAAAALLVVTGGFGTVVLPLGQRALFWLVLMGWTAIKWQGWFALTVRCPSDWPRAAILGGVLLSLPLPFEIYLAARTIGVHAGSPAFLATWGRALAVGGVIYVTALLVLRHLRPKPAPRAEAPATGLLDRARAGAETLAAIEAEDHYCRVRRRDGSDALIHYRFGDALGEVAGLDGVQVHRGAWVAAGAVTGAVRDGRRWHLLLAGGGQVPVSATYLAKVRELGWLRR